MKICFVCLGNICRSPTAEAILRQLIENDRDVDASKWTIASAGTANYHIGKQPDARAMATAEKHGVPMRSRAQQFGADFFERFDLIVPMDARNEANIRALLAPDSPHHNKIHMLREYSAAQPGKLDVPDPYHHDEAAFENTFRICEEACTSLWAELKNNRTQPSAHQRPTTP